MVTPEQGRGGRPLRIMAAESFLVEKMVWNFRVLTCSDCPDLNGIPLPSQGKHRLLGDLTLIQFGKPSLRKTTQNYNTI